MSQGEAGFPWFGQPQLDGSQPQPEKVVDAEKKGMMVSKPGSNGINKHASLRSCSSEKQHQNVKNKKRSGSGQASASQKPFIRSQKEYQPTPGAAAHHEVRTIPPWVRDAEEDDLEYLNAEGLLDSPNAALVAQHNFATSQTKRKDRGHITSSGKIRHERTSRWISFARASAYPREQFDNEKVDAAWLNEHFTDYSKPWLAGQDDDDEEIGSGRYKAFRRKRQAWYTRIQFSILRNPFVPLVFRLTVMIFAATAIGLGASIYRDTGVILLCTQQDVGSRTPQCLNLLGYGPVNYYRDPSALMAIIVDAIAIVYTLYITYDEYFSKPLGLRPARAKIRLVLLDLFFIVFQAANLSLAFESLTVDEGACAVGEEPSTSTRFDHVCDRAESLSAVLFVSLVAWLLTFSVSVLRLVERINPS